MRTIALAVAIKIAVLLSLVKVAVAELIRNECFTLCLEFWYRV